MGVGEEQDEIRRTVTLTEGDAVAANQLFYRGAPRKPGAMPIPVFLGVMVTTISAIWSTGPSGALRALEAGLLTTFVLYVLKWLRYAIVIPALARKDFRKTAGMREPTDYRITPDRLSYVQEDCSADMALRTLPRWRADDRCLMLHNTRLTFYILPRRDFSDDEVARIESWLTAAGVERR